MLPSMLVVAAPLGIAIALVALYQCWQCVRHLWSSPAELDKSEAQQQIAEIDELSSRHELAAVLSELINLDGAGSWPPKANHTSWPAPLKAYQDIYYECVPYLPAALPSLDDDVNNERRNNFRALMRKLLLLKVNIPEVQAIMAEVEAGDRSRFPRDAYNGFYCCIAVSRHAYRWATIPVVKVAQRETIVDFPPELDAPWPYLQRAFGVQADSGNNTANVVHNFNEQGERMYKINVGMNDLITSSEEVFFRMFYDLEVAALPIYYDMVRATMSFQQNDKAACVKHLDSININLRELLQVFYQNLVKSRVSMEVWLSYVQGFQGWGVGRMIDGEFVKYDGLSGNHVLFFQALDAFLGMDRYLTPENMDRYIPARQREFSLTLKKFSFRNAPCEEGDEPIKDELTKIVNQLKVFRAAHRTRVMPYLTQPAPERLTMTAGKSVLETDDKKDIKDALKVLDDMMAKRISETK